MSESSFRVDLRGIVDLLSHHLYSSPRVYVRELLQNAVDALTVRRDLDPDGPSDREGRVLFVPADVAADGRLHCLDTGVGLTAAEVERFLATIGSSSKRDELGFARSDLLGQFGIGLLSCFLISDEISMLTRSARGGPAVRWQGWSDGSYRIDELDEDAAATALTGRPAAADGLPTGPGTWVALRPRPGMSDWTGFEQVAALAGEYGRMLPWDVAVAAADGPARRVTTARRPWEQVAEPASRAELEELAGSPALAVIPVQVPEADLSGALVVLARPGATIGRQAHRVYVKSMLVGDHVDGVLPAWAFFARAVVDAGQLRMTASREGLYDDDLLERVRETLGEALRRWMLRTARVNRELFGRFLGLHALGVKAVAAVDDGLAAAVLPWLTFETTAGAMTLPELADRFGVVRYATTVDEYRQIAPVAAAQGMGVVNAGYTYDVPLLERFAGSQPAARVEPIVPGDLDTHVGLPPEPVLAAMWPFLLAARAALDPLDVDVQLRVFQPATLPALVLDDREARYRRSARAVAAQQDEGSAWGGILDALDDGGHDRRVLMMNAENPTVARLAGLSDPGLVTLAVEGLYSQALLAGQHPMQPADTEALNRSFLGLIERAVQ